MPTLFPCMGGLLEDKRQENIKQSRHIEYSYDTNDLLVIFKRERCPGIKLSARKTLFCTFRLYVRYQDINTSMYTHLIAMTLDECPWCWFSLLQFNCLDIWPAMFVFVSLKLLQSLLLLLPRPLSIFSIIRVDFVSIGSSDPFSTCLFIQIRNEIFLDPQLVHICNW